MRRPRISIRWMMVLVAFAGIWSWWAVEFLVRRPEQVRLRHARVDRAIKLFSVWTALAAGYPDGTRDRRDCQEMADWRMSRANALLAEGANAPLFAREEAGQDARERALVRRLGLGKSIGATYGLGDTAPTTGP